MGFSYGYEYSTSASSGIGPGYLLFLCAICFISIASMWKIFTKAGQEGWKALIPIYNIIVLLEIVGLPIWYIVLFFVPLANIYAIFKIYIELAHKFGKSTGFGVCCVFFSFICMPILAFGSNQYEGSIGPGYYTNYNYQGNPYPNYGQPMNNYGQSQPMNYSPQQQVQANSGMQSQNMYNAQPVNNQNAYGSQPTMNNQNYGQSQPMNYSPQQQVPVNSDIQSQNMYNAQPMNHYEQPVQQNMDMSKKHCPACGNTVDVSADTCFLCGYKF